MLNYLEKAEAVGIAITNAMFCEMLNPKYRGPKFKWENFEDFCAEHSAVRVFMYFSDSTFIRHRKAIIEKCENAARIRAQECLESSGVMEWLKL